MSEQRPIDAYGVQRLLNMSYHGCGLDSFSLGFRKALGLAIQTIENAPTIDPVRHGKWSDPLEGKDRAFQCSLCGGLAFNHGLLTACPYKYCPHCGARMDMDKE